jgi:hypothetical protein
MTTNRAEPGFDPTDDDDFDPADEVDPELAESMASEIAAARERIARVPAATVVANHAMGLFELAAIHLMQDPPKFSEATLAIDAVAALVDRLSGRLGDAEATLRQALAQLRLDYVRLKDHSAAASDSTD